jgi:AraC-like DNA-binding protein
MEDIFGAAGRELGARLAEDTPREAVPRLGRFLLAKLDGRQPDLRLEHALRWARSVDAAAEMLNVSPRTVRAQALQLCGLGPKRMLRIRRLHRALACGAAPLAVWSDIASRAGYADQAHMVREFRSLLGESPETWRRRAAADLFNTPHGQSASLRA